MFSLETFVEYIFLGAILPVKVRAGSAISDQKIVPQDLFDKMQNDIIEKDELITTLQNKVSLKCI